MKSFSRGFSHPGSPGGGAGPLEPKTYLMQGRNNVPAITVLASVARNERFQKHVLIAKLQE